MTYTKKINYIFDAKIKWEGRDTRGLHRWIAYANDYRSLWETLVDARVMHLEDFDEKVLAKSGLSIYDELDEETYESAMEIGLDEEEYRELIEESIGNAYYQKFYINGEDEDEEDEDEDDEND